MKFDVKTRAKLIETMGKGRSEEYQNSPGCMQMVCGMGVLEGDCPHDVTPATRKCVLVAPGQ